MRATIAKRIIRKPTPDEGPTGAAGSTVAVAGGVAVAASTPPLGAVLGAVLGALDGSVDGAVDGAVEGAVDGAVEGAVEGAVDGALDGALEGGSEGASAQGPTDRSNSVVQPFEPVGSSPAVTLTFAVWPTVGLLPLIWVENEPPKSVTGRTDVPSIEAAIVLVTVGV